MSHTGSLTSETFSTGGTEWCFEELLHGMVTVLRGTSIKCLCSSEEEMLGFCLFFVFCFFFWANQEGLMEEENGALKDRWGLNIWERQFLLRKGFS